MFGNFKLTNDYNIMAQSMGQMYKSLGEIAKKVEGGMDINEFTEEVLILAFVGRKSILDKFERNNWKMQNKIAIPEMKKFGFITLEEAFSASIEDLMNLANLIGESDVVEDILRGGSAYKEMEKTLPPELLKKVL